MPRCFVCRRSGPLHAPRFRQLLLGASPDGQLCILATPIPVPIDRPSEVALGTSYIIRIPDELLNEILIHALRNELFTTNFYTTAVVLSKVSKHFHRIVQPLMYSTIRLSEHSIVRPCLAVKQFLKTIQGNPALGFMVKTLCVRMESFLSPSRSSEAEFRIGIELLGLLPNIESFDLHGGYEYPSTWPMIRNAVANWPRIKHIGLWRGHWSLLIPSVCELVLATPGLSSLSLNGITTPEPSDSTSHAVWTPRSKDLERTSNITTLTINHFGERPEALQSLLKVPRALEHFTFGEFNSDPVRWRLEMFQSLLAPHQTTLKSIEIGSLGLGYTPIDFLSFPKLEVLNLSQRVYRETPEVATASLLAPKLHTLIWNVTIIDPHSEPWTDSGEEQKKWLLNFAELAKERKSGLRKIRILFSPNDHSGPRTREELAACVTPWDLMDEVRDKIRTWGIELNYDKPWTREECLQTMSWRRSTTGKHRKLGTNNILARFG